ncbi:MAG: tRNA glutamyl-Q(34) synthetase GluQRS [Gammaproteobacteria bacterium]|nr:tRNA glutamyl-Q(34) synthetase GluQRS [Gammaproteobacteria bacterium]
MPDPADLSLHSTANQYIGRFAPSPTGPLHSGSLMAAMASFLDARSRGGKWLVRMEDLDPPRETREAADDILFALEKLHLQWDESVLYQSQRYPAYQEAINKLAQAQQVFGCDCTRQQIQESHGVYPGTCRDRQLQETSGIALRCKVSGENIIFNDKLQGKQQQNLEHDVGDFVIKRKDGLFAYQLAVVVDDAFQNITDIVRGIDLMDSTARQIRLQQLLGLPQPNYVHVPVIVNEQGQKLSKQHRASPIDTSRPVELLIESLRFLQQSPEKDLAQCSPEEVLDWGIRHWNPDNLINLSELQEFQPDA